MLARGGIIRNGVDDTFRLECICHYYLALSSVPTVRQQVGLVGGGTGMAPLMQIVRILLADPADPHVRIGILSINRREEDILMREDLDSLASLQTSLHLGIFQ